MALRLPVPQDDGGDPAVVEAKRLVWNTWSTGGVVPEPTAFADDVEFHGPAPIGVLRGRDKVLGEVHGALDEAFPAARREPYLFLGGVWNDEVWVAVTGNIVGPMTGPWLGIGASGVPTTVRFGEFHRVIDNQVVDTRCLFRCAGRGGPGRLPVAPCRPAPGHPTGSGRRERSLRRPAAVHGDLLADLSTKTRS